MEQFFYSASARGFFISAIHGDAMPADVVPVTVERHAELLAGQSAGHVIEPDAYGVPQIVARQDQSAAELLGYERQAMVLTRLQFALQALADGVMTAAETEAFLGPRAVPQIGEDALLLIEDMGLRVVARMRLVGFERMERNDPLLVPFQAAVGWTDAEVDAFFRAGMLL
jgi:hypothetical protein